jgi:hypothetical protein
MTVNKLFLGIALSIVSVASYAQIPENRDARHMSCQMLLSVEDYCRTSTLYNDEYRREFIKLFDAPDSVCVYNDLMNSASYQRTVSPQDYMRQYSGDDDMMLETDYSDLSFVSPFEYRDGRWYRKVMIRKTMKIIDSVNYTGGAGGVLYDSAQLYPDDPAFSLEIELVYDSDTDRCLISSIDVALSKPATPIDADSYSVIVKSGTKFDERVKSAGKSLAYNDFDEAFATYNEYSVNDSDVKIAAEELARTDRYNVLKLRFIPKHMRIKLRADFAPFGAYDVTRTSNSIAAESWAREFGLDLGYTFSVGKAKMGLFTGVAASLSGIDLSMTDFSFSYKDMLAGRGNARYERRYDISEATEGLSMKDIVIPVYWGAEHNAGDWGKITWDLGVKIYLNRQTDWDAYHLTGNAYGKFEDGSLVYESADYSFGDFDQNYMLFISPVDYSRAAVDYSLFGRFGLDIFVAGNLAACLSAGYEYGLNSSYESSMREYLNLVGSVIPMVYSHSMNQNLAVHSFLGSISYRRQGIWLSAGLKYKF